MTGWRGWAGRPRLGRRGGVTIVVAVVAVALIGFAGFAVDTTRAWRVSARLKASVDAAAMMAARRIDQPSRDSDALDMFWLNFRRNQPPGASYLGATITGITITQLDVNRVRVTSTASMATTLFSVLFSDLVQVTETSIAQRQASGLEIAMAIDVATSSDGEGASDGPTRLAAVQTGARRMLDILYGSTDTRPNLSVSVVPFARGINIGTSSSTLLNENGMPPGWSRNAWGGCVEARSTGNRDLTDDPPTNPPSRFRPWFWPSTYRQVGTVQQGRCSAADSYPPQPGDGQTRYCFGDNDWGAPQALLDLNPNVVALRGRGLGRPDAAGPNLMCGAVPLQALTVSRSNVQQAIDAVTAQPTTGGRTLATGLQGAWYTLSPNWQGTWPDPNGGSASSLPRPYSARSIRKVAVLVSNGDDDWLPQSAYTPRVRATQNGNGAEQFYSAYGRAQQWNGNGMTPPVAPGDRGNGSAATRNRFSRICTAMKDQGITIYVLAVDVPSATARGLLQGCATGTESYFEAAGVGDLANTFSRLANALTGLRMTE